MAKGFPVKIENRQQWLIVVTIAVVVVFAADRLVFGPLTKLWKARSTQVAELRKEVADGSLLLQREKSLRTRWDSMRANALSNNTSLAEQQLLKAFDAWSQESRVSITGITPQWKHDADDYMTLECHVDASGDMATLMRLLYDIEKDPMALKLELVDLNSRDNAGRELSMGIRVSGLVLTPGEQRQ
jgi:hypothetical protein